MLNSPSLCIPLCSTGTSHMQLKRHTLMIAQAHVPPQGHMCSSLITASICAHTHTKALTCTVLISTVVHMYVSAHTQTHTDVYPYRLIHVYMHIHSDGHTPNTFHPLLPTISVSTVLHARPSVCGHPPKTDSQV